MELGLDDIRAVCTLADLADVLRRLRRREARSRNGSSLSYRELAAKTGWAHGIIGDYFSGQALAPTDRFDVLIRLLGVTTQEMGPLATARDRVEESRRRTRSSPDSRTGAPKQLPAPPAPFVGRHQHLQRMDAHLKDTSSPAKLIALCGTAGAGKTALGLHFARTWSSRFPDGSLYADLRGFSPDQPATATEVLSRFLRSLGVPGTELAADATQLATHFRTLATDRKMIVFLDNAQSAQQVRPLLTSTATSLTIVTSRDHLAGLVARDGATRVDVGLLTRPEATTLLRQLIGDRVDGEPAAAEALASRCARLPLALRVAAELAARRSTLSLAELVGELAGDTRTLDLLEAGGDPQTAIRPILSWSYQSLSPEAAQCFRALGHFSCTDLDVEAIAALSDVDTKSVRKRLEELTKTHLAESREPGRYGMHDLLHAFAAEQVARHPEQPYHLAMDRLERYYLNGCREAIQSVYPAESGAVSSSRNDAQSALRWLNAQLANTEALSRQGLGNGRTMFAVELSRAMWNYLDRSAHYPEAMSIHSNAIAAARAGGDPRGEAAALGELGQILCRQGRYQEALEQLEQALLLGRNSGDQGREAITLNSLSIAHSRLGNSAKALEYLHLALLSHRAQGNPVGEGKVLSNLGIEYAQLGQYADAVTHFEHALAIARSLGDQYGLANALNNLGLVTCWLTQYEQSVDYQTQGLAHARHVGDRAGEGRLLANLGVNHTRLGNLAQAETLLTQAMSIHREAGDRAAEAEAFTYLGDLHHALGAYPTALTHHEQSLALAVEIGYRHVQGPAHNGAAHALTSLNRPVDAASRFGTALSLAREAGDRLQEAHALTGIAGLCDASGEPDAAREARQQAESIYLALGIDNAQC